jgi:hypothetical protein
MLVSVIISIDTVDAQLCALKSAGGLQFRFASPAIYTSGALRVE